ncbi:cupin domain-containing protein [Propioniferax innocua]|uniref:AraC-like protein n=1 Tax=Propioniferax innocua TaxID=1753 RepID=A0A542ZBR7_9ACTN|nr:cupin domain-containing protein [Propioniferax innocua]TQL57795.1 hypothetical protein FB460_1637 [Propioniferax innocua]
MNADESPETVTAGLVDQGSTAGDSEGEATLAALIDQADSRNGKPGAKAVLAVDGTKVVAFEFATGDVLADHAARHPVLIQVIRGRVEFTLPDGPITLEPGQVLHLTPMLRHAVTALEPTTLTVTMLLPRD